MSSQPTPSTPLVLVYDCLLLALDPATGARLWHQRLPREVHRLFQIAGTVLVTCGRTVQAFSLVDGHPIGMVTLEFHLESGAVHGERLLLVGSGAAAAVDATGRVLWTCSVKDKNTSLLTMDCYLSGRDSAGRETWRVDLVDAPSTPCGLMIGGTVVQPDETE